MRIRFCMPSPARLAFLCSLLAATLIASLGCHSVAILRDGLDRSGPDQVSGRTAYPTTADRPVLVVPPGVRDEWVESSPAAPDLFCPERGVSFRSRVLGQQAVIQRGPAALPGLVDACSRAPVGSYARRDLAFIVEQIQNRQTEDGLIRELTRERGLRQRAAVRASVGLGVDAVPTLLGLLTHSDPVVRCEVIRVLRQLTRRHPSLTGQGLVHAVRVWRSWYETARPTPEPPLPRPAPAPRPRIRREPVLPDLDVTVSM